METEFYKYVDVAEAAKDLNIPKELAAHIHAFWTLKRKVGIRMTLKLWFVFTTGLRDFVNHLLLIVNSQIFCYVTGSWWSSLASSVVRTARKTVRKTGILVCQACAVKIGGCVAVNRDEWSTSNLLSFSLWPNCFMRRKREQISIPHVVRLTGIWFLNSRAWQVVVYKYKSKNLWKCAVTLKG